MNNEIEILCDIYSCHDWQAMTEAAAHMCDMSGKNSDTLIEQVYKQLFETHVLRNEDV